MPSHKNIKIITEKIFEKNKFKLIICYKFKQELKKCLVDLCN